ncbi:putative glutamine-dependent NAD(+) synthetase [Campylobacterota bacterium]|nr:putative glutamine-dependent NAD(+) synthetase [Campylobacterota bacterium]
MKKIRIALSQQNFTVGAICENTEKIVSAIGEARAKGVDLVIFPELAVTGYPPEDLLFKPDFISKNIEAVELIARECTDIAAIVGFADRKSDIFNAAALIENGEIKAIYHKQNLPNYGVFDEQRYFAQGAKELIFAIGGYKIALLICEDLWNGARFSGAIDAVISINASPFSASKREHRRELLSSRARELRSFVIYANLVGAQDELVFDGESAIVDPRGAVIARSPAFAEDLLLCDLDLEDSFRVRLKDARVRATRRNDRGNCGDRGKTDRAELKLNLNEKPKTAIARQIAPIMSEIEAIYSALKLGLKDYVVKNGFKSVVLGLSGGIDSALAAALAADAIGGENVLGVLMPSKFSSQGSIDDALALAKNLQIRTETLAINDLMEGFDRALKPLFAGAKPNVAEENLQARIRMCALMAISNKFGYLVLSTSNKSEIAVGYSTLYGDMAGGFAPIKDVLKTRVYELAEYRNTLGEAIPQMILIKPPSAELRYDQKDADELPDYEILDRIIRLFVEEDYSLSEIDALGVNEQIVRKIAVLIRRNEYKRSQSAIGTKISDRAFGRDRRMPIVNNFIEGGHEL